MKPYQAIGWTLLQTSAITAITSRIYHGLRPEGTTVPAINYYEVGGAGRLPGMESVTYSINCRAATAGAARDLADLVLDLFAGTSGTGIYATQNGFDIARASSGAEVGLIPEPDDGIYNAPVEITMVYSLSTVS